ncbi:MAG: FMN-binding negative transcriptional regulator, partial [Sphingopyxis sp.]|nr:FMN-binding negative transcriptional regulator [Sphingopyxis sp.]
AMRALVADVGFGMLFAATPDGPRVVHVPCVWMGDALTFHIARGNALARHLDGATALFVVNGPDAYVSPDWYALDHNQVPTWNYLAVELEGRVSKLDRDGLMAQVDALTAHQETRLPDHTPWTRDKADPALMAKLFDAIIGFSLVPQAWRGTMKLGQNKPESARHAVADQLDRHGRRAMAHLMRG